MHRVLAFGCHPDDVEFICAGTLALLAQRGCEIHIAIMAGGEMGSPTLPPDEIRALRQRPWYQSVLLWWVIYTIVWVYLYWRFW